MKTVFLLMAEFDTSQINLEDMCEKYLKMDVRTAKRKAKLQQLPFPVSHDPASQKAPYLVHVIDLAEYLDKINALARKDWARMQAAAQDNAA